MKRLMLNVLVAILFLAGLSIAAGQAGLTEELPDNEISCLSVASQLDNDQAYENSCEDDDCDDEDDSAPKE